ncbi:squalene synthetase-like protein [Vanrija albida]|uniref:Protein SQS1 n=1 Tax=Vanrija albida TaxID=181172 RepID=A0ABR3Q7E7_9TREE
MPRQAFGDFLNTPSPSPFRGRGRGRGGRGGGARGGGARGGGGRGGARGGRGGGGIRGGHFSADYTNMTIDYAAINSAGYKRFDQMAVQPFGERGRGRGRGGGGGGVRPRAEHTPNATDTDAPSGSRTPATGGLGYHRGAVGARRTPGTMTPTRTDASGATLWGGHGAPLFVKAGELFRDGEVDVVRRDGDTLRVETYPLSDPSAPQMLRLADELEVELDGVGEREVHRAVAAAHGDAADEESVEEVLAVVETVVVEAAVVPAVEEEEAPDEPIAVDAEEETREDVVLEEAQEVVVVLEEAQDDTVVLEDVVVQEDVVVLEAVDVAAEDVEAEDVEAEDSDAEDVEAEGSDDHDDFTALADRFAGDSDADSDADEHSSAYVSDSPPADIEIDDAALFFVDTGGDAGPTSVDDAALFFVDTGADPSTSAGPSAPLYDAPTAHALGTRPALPKQSSTAEDIIFRPKIISDPVASASTSRAPATAFELRDVYVDPRVTLNRKDRKAAKREKRARNKRKQKSGRRSGGGAELAPRDDSDIDWGSDGPPPRRILGIVDDEVSKIGRTLASTDLEDEVDPELNDEDLTRFIAGMVQIEGDRDVMDLMEHDDDEWSGSEGKGKGKAVFADADLYDSGSEDDDSEEDDDGDDDDDFAQLQAAYDVSDDDSSDDDAAIERYRGQNAWEEDDEAAWFADSMDAALDGGAMSSSRKDRNKIFKAVVNGSFDRDLPIAPAKKDKNGAHVPPQLLDQWERDRQKKAEKKRAREAARLEALLNPYPGAHKGGKKGKKASKLQGKAAAAMSAHLIPASAAEVAELFDITSDEDDGWGVARINGRKGRALLLPQTLEQVNAQVAEFMADATKTTLTLPPMDKEARKKVHMLAECYDLKSKSRGKGLARFPVLIKLVRSGLRDEDKLERLIAASSQNGGAFYKALYARKSKDGRKAPGGAARSGGPSTRAREGELVGEGADKIGEDNIGHRLLSKMGWSEGGLIGRTGGGLDAPIVAVVKYTKRGLGT